MGTPAMRDPMEIRRMERRLPLGKIFKIFANEDDVDLVSKDKASQENMDAVPTYHNEGKSDWYWMGTILTNKNK